MTWVWVVVKRATCKDCASSVCHQRISVLIDVRNNAVGRELVRDQMIAARKVVKCREVEIALRR